MKTELWRQKLTGESPAIESVLRTVSLVSCRLSTVLITGETGTGKEMAARAIHEAGPRSGSPFIAVNCAAIPISLMESELFGHVRGAFTGALNHRVGYFEQASRGTIFLDEVGELPLELQGKLLRVLQEREFQRLGSSSVIRTEARVIAATNIRLEENVRAGRFREDLFYRLNVLPLHMPPLRERRPDIPLLVRHFIRKICGQESIPEKGITENALHMLMSLDWPGNVRQLENTVEMAVILSEDEPILDRNHFLLMTGSDCRDETTVQLPASGLNLDQYIGSLELSLLHQALERAKGNKTLAAGFLCMNRTTLSARLKSLSATASE